MRDEHLDRTRIERVDPLVGAVLDGRYHIDFRLAAGGFGAIYRATDTTSGNHVALKVLHTELASNDARVIARFRREGAMLMQLRSPHTITAYELGEDSLGSLYIVMELLDGESLYEVFRAKGPLPWQRVVAIARMACDSLAEAHALGIVHRDLKPANIHLERRDGIPDFVKVLDFGIAKIVRESDIIDNSDLTQAGQVIGTFDYMAPEQMVGQCTAATDLYALAVVMYEMISGRRPFGDIVSPTALLAALLTQTAPRLSQFVPVPAALDTILARCLEREPHLRPMHAAELAKELDRLLAPDEGVTLRKSVTPMPLRPANERSHAPIVHEEDTVIAQPRAKRESAPSPPQEPVAPERPKRDSAPPDYAAKAFVVSPGAVQELAELGSSGPQQSPSTWQVPTRPTPPAFGYNQFPSTHGSITPTQPPAPVRPSAVDLGGYNMSGAQDRDLLVRRIVWAIALALGVVLVLVIASRL